MLIGELALESGLSPDTIRWYEKVGLLATTDASRDTNNYRIYDEAALEKLIMIKQTKSFGFSIKEIKEMLELIESGDLNCDSVSPMIDTKLTLIDKKIAYLQTIRQKLTTLQERCNGNCQEEIQAG